MLYVITITITEIIIIRIILRRKGCEEYEWVQMRPRAWHHLDELFAGKSHGYVSQNISYR